MNRIIIFTMITMVSVLLFIFPVFAEDVTEPVKVDASEADREVTVGDVNAEQFGVHVQARNGHTAFVNAENVIARFIENLPLTAALYVEADGNGSLANVNTKDLTAEEEINTYGTIVRILNGGRAVVNTGSTAGTTGVDIQADGRNSNATVTTGNLNASHIGLSFYSNDYAEIDVTIGNIHSFMDGIRSLLYAMAGNGGKVRVTTQDVIGENGFGIGGFASGIDSNLRMKTNDIRAGYIALDFNAENQAKVLVDAGNVTMINTSTEPYSAAFSRRGAGGHSIGYGSDLEFRISGSVFLSELGNEITDLNQQPSEGVLAHSIDNGNTVITIKKDVTVKAEKTMADVCGIRVENAGGTVTVSTGSGVSAEVPNSQKVYGLYIDNNSKLTSLPNYKELSEQNKLNIIPEAKTLSADPGSSRTTVSIDGDLSGTAYGLYLKPSADITADVLVTGTISGCTAAVMVEEGVTADNFDLTVWKIEPNSAGCVAVKTDGSCAENVEAAIKYIIKVNGSWNSLNLTYQDGKPLEISHGFPVAKAGEMVCLHSGARSNGNCIIISKGGSVSFTTDSGDGIDFFRILDKEGKLPATGFSAHSAFSLPLRPQGLVYGKTELLLQIPKLDVMEPIMTVPMADGAYPVEWLARDIGLLEGTALPGEGFSVLTGHNHLNTTEAGPFLFLGTLEENDLLLVTDAKGNTRNFHVFGNHLIAPDGLAALADDLTENTLLLVTCEDESVEGGYLHRRVILAEEK
jgi:LPXTG-site transpeptidase (sortase) family protein